MGLERRSGWWSREMGEKRRAHMHARTCTTMLWSHITMLCADLSSPPHLNPALGDARRSISPPTPMPSCISHLSHSTGTLASLSYTVARHSLSSFVLLNALSSPVKSHICASFGVASTRRFIISISIYLSDTRSNGVLFLLFHCFSICTTSLS